jgi:8-oxo-dGTP pyrophosphatase MutT (NUDIX family)
MTETSEVPCDSALETLVRTRLAAFQRREAPIGEGQKRAAVVLAIIEEGLGANLPALPGPDTWSAHAALLLTRRPAHMRRHAGQWALPGGRLDDGESAIDAARRELYEEVGLMLEPNAILGMLDDYATRSGFVITPVVAWAGAAVALKPDPTEVASLHRIPFSVWLRPDAPWLEPGPDHGRPILRMPVADNWIAAPTAAMIYQFRECCLLGRETRVSHFDQPSFAWV